MNRTTALAVAGIALLALATGCSDDKQVTLPSGSTPVGESLPAATEQPAGDPAAGDSPMGSCHVTVTGDVTAEWTSDGGAKSVGYGPWIPQAGGTTAIGALDESFFILNCKGPGESYIGFGPVHKAKIPMQPGTYTIEPATNVAGSSENGIITAMLGLDGTDTNWGASAQGQLVITAFDDQHIAGTFTIPVTDVLTKLSGTHKGEAVITGEFDYANPV